MLDPISIPYFVSESLPRGLQADGAVKSVEVVRRDNRGREQQTVRAVARGLPDGNVVVIGRNIDEFAEIGTIVEQALVVGVIPALCSNSHFDQSAGFSVRLSVRGV